MPSAPQRVLILAAATLGLQCGGSSDDSAPGAPGASSGASSGSSGASNGSSSSSSGGSPSSSSGGAGGGSSGGPLVLPPTDPSSGPPPGNPTGTSSVPAEAQLEDVTNPRTVVGTGSAASCTSAAFVDAVAKGGVITFSCGDAPVTIMLDATAKIVNDTGPKIVIDGGGKVTLSGQGQRRILYQNTCDEAQKYTTDHCQDQDTPQLSLQNLTFVDGNSTGETAEGGGGGAVFVRGGRVKIIGSRFFHNQCDKTGQDLGGAAVRVLSQSQDKPVYVVQSTFGGSEALGNFCSNGGSLSSVGVSYTVINSFFSHNRATGTGGNPAPGKPGGGSGGAIYNDGNTFTLTLDGTLMEDNHANEGGGAIFFVSNDGSGSLVIKNSTLRRNVSDGFETDNYPGIFVQANGDPQVEGSTLEK